MNCNFIWKAQATVETSIVKARTEVYEAQMEAQAITLAKGHDAERASYFEFLKSNNLYIF